MQRQRLLTPNEVAHYLHVTSGTVRRWINEGVLSAIELPHTGPRRSHRIEETTLDTLKRLPQAAHEQGDNHA
jgi:excisionase family DNA binding protein